MNKLSLLLFLVVLGSKLVNAQKQPQNSATIHGTIVDFDGFKDKVNQVRITITDPVKVVHALTPNKDGFFTLTFPKQFQQDILIQFNDSTPIKVLIAPGQTQTYVFNPLKYDLRLIDCTGDGATTVKMIGDYLSSIKIYREGTDSRYSIPYAPPSLASLKNSQTLLEDYIKNHQVNQDFIRWARADLKAEFAYLTVFSLSNQHRSVADSFFLNFPLDDTAGLISSNHMRLLNYRASDVSFTSSYVSTMYVGIKDNNHYAKVIQKFHPQYVERIEDYPVDKGDRVKVKYIVQNSTGKVRDMWLANLITESLKRKDKDIRFQKRLMRDYKEFAPNGIYTKQLEEQLAVLLKQID